MRSYNRYFGRLPSTGSGQAVHGIAIVSHEPLLKKAKIPKKNLLQKVGQCEYITYR